MRIFDLVRLLPDDTEVVINDCGSSIIFTALELQNKAYESEVNRTEVILHNEAVDERHYHTTITDPMNLKLINSCRAVGTQIVVDVIDD